MYQLQLYSHIDNSWINLNADNGWCGVHNNITGANIEREEVNKYYKSDSSHLPVLVRIKEIIS